MKKKYFVIGLSILILFGVAVGLYEYNRPERNLTETQPDLSIEASAIYKQFSENETSANKQYLDKVVQVKGTLKSIDRGGDGSLNLNLDAGSPMGGVTCEVPPTNVPQGLKLQVGQAVTVKGQCTGFLMDVVLVKCVIVQ